jgi:hypothetical protein
MTSRPAIDDSCSLWDIGNVSGYVKGIHGDGGSMGRQIIGQNANFRREIIIMSLMSYCSLDYSTVGHYFRCRLVTIISLFTLPVMEELTRYA